MEEQLFTVSGELLKYSYLEIILGMTLSFVLGIIIAKVYIFTHKGLSCEVEVDPEVTIDSEKLMDTGHIDRVDNVITAGIEGAWVYGPFSLQGEYILNTISKNDIDEDILFNGYYSFVSFFITGESRPYRSSEGSFGSIKPKHKYGAWEIALRYSYIDLDDTNLQKGKEENHTAGINWYANPNLRFMVNYVKIDTDNSTRASDLTATLLRAQVKF